MIVVGPSGFAISAISEFNSNVPVGAAGASPIGAIPADAGIGFIALMLEFQNAESVQPGQPKKGKGSGVLSMTAAECGMLPMADATTFPGNGSRDGEKDVFLNVNNFQSVTPFGIHDVDFTCICADASTVNPVLSGVNTELFAGCDVSRSQGIVETPLSTSTTSTPLMPSAPSAHHFSEAGMTGRAGEISAGDVPAQATHGSARGTAAHVASASGDTSSHFVQRSAFEASNGTVRPASELLATPIEASYGLTQIRVPLEGLEFSQEFAHASLGNNNDGDGNSKKLDGSAAGTLFAVHGSGFGEGRRSAHIEGAKTQPGVAEQIQVHFRSHVEQLRERGHVKLEMDLHPPELGPVRLHLAYNDGDLNVRFVVQNDSVKAVLDHQLEPLRVRFLEMGFSLGQFDVRRDGNSSSGNSTYESNATERAALDPQPAVKVAARTFVSLLHQDSMIDVIA